MAFKTIDQSFIRDEELGVNYMYQSFHTAKPSSYTVASDVLKTFLAIVLWSFLLPHIPSILLEPCSSSLFSSVYIVITNFCTLHPSLAAAVVLLFKPILPFC